MIGLLPLVTGAEVAFWLLAPVMILAALGLIFAKKAVHCALCLAVVMISLAVQYAALEAPFLFVVQIIVYTGAILMLFLFVLMLVGVDSADSLIETIKGQRVLAIVAGVGVACLLIFAVGNAIVGRAERSDRRQQCVRRQRPGHRRADLHPVRVRLRSHVGAADHGSGRRDGVGPPRTADEEEDPGRPGRGADAALRRAGRAPCARCPLPACSPGTMRSTLLRCSRTAPSRSGRSRPP